MELAEIFRRYGPDYMKRFGDQMLPSHKRAIHDIAYCRTDAFGGHVDLCNQCGYVKFVYHSCCNRSCPKCHQEKTNQWIEKRESEILPVDYFHVVFTMPKELRELLRDNQKKLLSAQMQAAAYAIAKLAADPKYLGAKPTILCLLHTWARTMAWHPHVHCLVSAGGISPDNSQWLPTQYHSYLVPIHALAKIFRAKFIKLARKALPDQKFPQSIWKKNWIVYSKPNVKTDKGNDNLLKYLARYVYRIAITNQRILQDKDGKITFQYKDSKTYQTKQMTLDAMEFIRRFLQHVLPKGFHKVRFYGLLSPSNRTHLFNIKTILQMQAQGDNKPQSTDKEHHQNEDHNKELDFTSLLHKCPKCKTGYMITIEKLPKVKRDLNQRGPP